MPASDIDCGRNMRLDRYLGNATSLTRSQAQRAIRRGHVTVDGERITDPGLRVAPGARVVLADDPIGPPAPRYLMLHKPPGYVCGTDDPFHPTALDLLDVTQGARAGLHAAGRLDLDATGSPRPAITAPRSTASSSPSL